MNPKQANIVPKMDYTDYEPKMENPAKLQCESFTQIQAPDVGVFDEDVNVVFAMNSITKPARF